MTAENMTMLLAVLAVVTSGLTELIKNVLNSFKVKYASNVIALAAAVVVGVCGTVIFYMYNSISLTSLNIAWLLVMVVATAGCAMYGYDKVMQLIAQIIEILKKEQ